MDVTIIIPNYNGAGDIRTCLDALKKQTLAADVIVVDDGSTDDSVRMVEAWREESRVSPDVAADPAGIPEDRSNGNSIRSLKVLRHDENLGFAAAVNTGIRAAKTPYVVLLNNDAFAEETFTENLVRAMKRRKDVFSVQALMLQVNRDITDSSGDYFCALGWAFSPGRDRPASLYSRPARIMSACAGAAIYDRHILEELGLFDEAHFCYIEDVDIGMRAQRAGYKNYFEPSAVVHHKGSATSGSRYNAFKARMTTANSLYTACKNFPRPVLVLYAPLLFAGFAIKGAFYAKKGCFTGFVKGLGEGFAKISAYRKGGEVFRVESDPRHDAMFAMELLGNCVRRIAG